MEQKVNLLLFFTLLLRLFFISLSKELITQIHGKSIRTYNERNEKINSPLLWRSQPLDNYSIELLSLNEKNNILYLIASDEQKTFKDIRFLSIKNGQLLPQNYQIQELKGGESTFVFDNQGNGYTLFTDHKLNSSIYTLTSDLNSFKIALNNFQSTNNAYKNLIITKDKSKVIAMLDTEGMLAMNTATRRIDWMIDGKGNNFYDGFAVKENGMNIIYATSTFRKVHKINADNGQDLLTFPFEYTFVLLNDYFIAGTYNKINITLTIYDRMRGKLISKFNVPYSAPKDERYNLNLLLIPLTNNEFIISTFDISYHDNSLIYETFSNSMISKYQVVGSGTRLLLKYSLKQIINCDTLISQPDYLLNNNTKVVLKCFKDKREDGSIVVIDSLNGNLNSIVGSNEYNCQEVIDSFNNNLYQCCWDGIFNLSTTCSAYSIVDRK
ncbi:hypothetical protein ABK040_002530 [Willaertia magna]